MGYVSSEAPILIGSADASTSPQRVRISLEVSDKPPIPPPSADNAVYITCDPSSGGTGTLVSIPVSIRGNLNTISSFGLNLEFDSGLFEYQGTGAGTLTGKWALVDGNVSSAGKITLGGFAGSGSAIPAEITGTIAVVTLKVTGTGYSDGHTSQITISNYADDISGMPGPYSTSFTFRR